MIPSRSHSCSLRGGTLLWRLKTRPPEIVFLQRIFSTFPGGWPGAGLLVLRSALAAILIDQGYFYLLRWSQAGWLVRSAGITGVAAGILLLIGYFTPFASVLAGLICVLSRLSWFQPLSPNPFSAKLQVALGVLISIAMLCLGPGAYSIDSRLFGRREIIIPNASHPPDS